MLGDGIGSDGDHKTLDDVLDGSLDEFSEIKDVAHLTVIYYTTTKKVERQPEGGKIIIRRKTLKQHS